MILNYSLVTMKLYDYFFWEVPMSKLTLDSKRNIIKLWESGCDIDSIKLLTGFRKYDIVNLLMCTGLYGVA